jgi:hypothetical protein
VYEFTRFCVPRFEASSQFLALPSSSGDARPSGKSLPYRRAVRKMAGIFESQAKAPPERGLRGEQENLPSCTDGSAR